MTRWIKIARGHYRLEGTPYSVQSDGYDRSQSISADANYEGFTGGEWAVIRHHDETQAILFPDGGENLDWFPTMREARAAAERMVPAVIRDLLGID